MIVSSRITVVGLWILLVTAAVIGYAVIWMVAYGPRFR